MHIDKEQKLSVEFFSKNTGCCPDEMEMDPFRGQKKKLFFTIQDFQMQKEFLLAFIKEGKEVGAQKSDILDHFAIEVPRLTKALQYLKEVGVNDDAYIERLIRNVNFLLIQIEKNARGRPKPTHRLPKLKSPHYAKFVNLFLAN